MKHFGLTLTCLLATIASLFTVQAAAAPGARVKRSGYAYAATAARNAAHSARRENTRRSHAMPPPRYVPSHATPRHLSADIIRSIHNLGKVKLPRHRVRAYMLASFHHDYPKISLADLPTPAPNFLPDIPPMVPIRPNFMNATALSAIEN